MRHALAYALDKEQIRDRLYGPDVMQAKGWAAVTPSTIGYGPELDPFPFDPDQARHLLAEAGHRTPEHPEGKDLGKLIVNTWVSTELPLLPESAELVGQNWIKELGIDLEVRVGDRVALLKAHRAGDLNGQVLWRDNDTRIDATSITGGSYYGIPDYTRRLHNDPELFALVNEIMSIYDVEERPEALNFLYRRLREEQYELAVGYINIPWGIGPRILTWEPYPLALYPSALHTIVLK